MEFRQVTKVTHRILSAERLQTTIRSADGTPIHVNIPLFPPTFNPTRASIYAEHISQRWEPEQQDDPADFQRVQLVRQLLESTAERAIKDGTDRTDQTKAKVKQKLSQNAGLAFLLVALVLKLLESSIESSEAAIL